MVSLFQAVLDNGKRLELYEADGKLVVVSALGSGARSIPVELPSVEAADLAEAILRHLGEPTALSVFQAIVRDRLLKQLPSENKLK